MSIGYIYVAVLVALSGISLASIYVLGRAAPWTIVGWLMTIGYDLTASAEIVTHRHIPGHLPYVFLGLLIVAFVVAGVRDEPQAEPWYAPQRRGLTRREKRPV